jgi:hypothetical protein
MSNLLAHPNDFQFYGTDGMLHMGISLDIPIGAINPSYPGIPQFLSQAILRKRHLNNYLEDGLQTGHLTLDPNSGNTSFTSKQDKSSFIGFVFEAMTVRQINDNLSTIGKNVICWISHREGRSTPGMRFINQWEAIGTGLAHTQQNYNRYYEPNSNTDVLFVRAVKKKRQNIVDFEPLNINGTNVTAALQVKAITGNVRREIIIPLIEKKYSHVLTYLYNPYTRVHTYDECMGELGRMFYDGIFGYEELQKYQRSIICPNMIGIDQQYVNEYYNFVWHNHPLVITQTDLTNAAANLEISGYVKSKGLLLPSNLTLHEEQEF